MVAIETPSAAGRERTHRSRIRAPLLDEVRGDVAHLESEQIAELRRKNDERDAGGEADRDRVRDELDDRAHAREAHDDEKDAGHEGGRREAVVAVLLHDGVHDDDEGARGPADLNAAPGERGDDESTNDGGEQSLLGFDTGCDRERERQRQRHHADDQAGAQVLHEQGLGVTLAEYGDEFGFEALLGHGGRATRSPRTDRRNRAAPTTRSCGPRGR